MNALERRLARVESRALPADDETSYHLAFKPREGASEEVWADYHDNRNQPGKVIVVSFIRPQ
jgi:hypothetical protein